VKPREAQVLAIIYGRYIRAMFHNPGCLARRNNSRSNSCFENVWKSSHHRNDRSHSIRSMRPNLFVPENHRIVLHLTIIVLNDWVALYLSAQTAGNPALLTETVFPNLPYTEQFKPANISSGILSKPLNITQYRIVLDEVLCTAFTEITVTDLSHPYVYKITSRRL
jgi:hypothetical protein